MSCFEPHLTRSSGARTRAGLGLFFLPSLAGLPGPSREMPAGRLKPVLGAYGC